MLACFMIFEIVDLNGSLNHINISQIWMDRKLYNKIYIKVYIPLDNTTMNMVCYYIVMKTTLCSS